MGTRSTITKVLPGGMARSIYCHWDGYLDHNGRILLEHYQDEAKIDALLDLGHLSSLGAEIGEKHDFNSKPGGVCNAYGRDQGEIMQEAKVYPSLADAIGRDRRQEFDYVRIGGSWFLMVDGEPKSLAQAIADEDKE